MRRWWWPPLVVALAGLLATAWVVRDRHARAGAAQAAALDRSAAQLGFTIAERVKLPAEALHTVAAFVAHAPTIDRSTFEAVAAAVLRRMPRLYALEWAPVVPHDRRAALEAAARAEGQAEWAIREPTASGMVPAAQRERYLPILYSYPTNAAVGFDVLSRDEAAEVYRQACETGQAVLSPRYRLIEDRDDIASLILYVPVWRGGRVPEDRAARLRDALGVAILVFRVEEVLRDAVTATGVSGVDVTLDDISDAAGGVLFESRPGTAAAAAGLPHRDRVLPMYGRSWRLRVSAPQASPYPIGAALVGGSATAVAALFAAVVAWLVTNRQRLRAITQLGQYRVDREIGRGAMGVVYRAEHLLLHRPAALKLLAPGTVDAVARTRFEREVRLAAKLQHPSIVSVYDFGVTAEGLFFYAMELLEGVTFRELVDTEAPLPPPRAVALMRQIAEALREAHAKQIVHRDLAPANLMLTVRGAAHDVVKILDFGLVKRIRPVPGEPDGDAATDAGMIVGTPGFIAPEVIRGRSADERVDIYALGAVSYGLVSGRFPFVGVDGDATLRAQLQPPVPLRKLVPELPIALADLINDCMQLDPRLRIRSMREVAARLDALELPPWTADDARRAWQARTAR